MLPVSALKVAEAPDNSMPLLALMLMAWVLRSTAPFSITIRPWVAAPGIEPIQSSAEETTTPAAIVCTPLANALELLSTLLAVKSTGPSCSDS